MPTEEKIRLYNELNPTGKKFPSNKKPDEKAEDMEWLDKKLSEFGAFDKEEEEPVEVKAPEVKTPKVKVTSEIKTYTVAELLHMSFDNHAKAMKEIRDGKAKVL